MFFIPPEDMPEEIREMFEHQQLANTSQAHEIANFVEGLKEDQLVTMRTMFAMTGGNYAAFVNGIITKTLDVNFGVCMACSKKHGDELAEMANGGTVTPPAEPVEEFPVPTDVDTAPLRELRLKAMGDYNVEPAADDPEGVVCKGCGLFYKSLVDRMIKGPDNCHGCIEKAKWG